MTRDPVRTWTDRTHLGVGEGGQQLLQPAPMHDRVVVQEDDDVAPGDRGALVAPRANPRFSSLRTTSTQGYVASSSPVASVDPLSTTTTWSPGLSVGRKESRQGPVWSHAFQARMTMVAREPELCVLTSTVNGPLSPRKLTPGTRCTDRSDAKGIATVSVVRSLEEIDTCSGGRPRSVSRRPRATLRRWRTDLVRASVLVSYAIGVLSLDKEILTRDGAALSDEVLAARVDELPRHTGERVGRGRVVAVPRRHRLVAAAAEVAMDQSDGLLRLHADVVLSDLADPDVVAALLADVEQLAELVERRATRKPDPEDPRGGVKQYGSGAASVDDWLT